ncbi:MAG: hypothetical protein ACR2GW_13815, partial [Pyrinomonadaceae bacterium]
KELLNVGEFSLEKQDRVTRDSAKTFFFLFTCHSALVTALLLRSGGEQILNRSDATSRAVFSINSLDSSPSLVENSRRRKKIPLSTS